jgi:CRP-like cAMP-binding protein
MLDEMAVIAFLAGIISAISLPLGAALGLAIRPGPKITSALMAFGAGALLFALTIEIVAPSFRHAGFAPLAVGCVLGGVLFELLNQALNSRGAFLRKAATLARHATLLKRRQAESVLSRLARARILQEIPPEEIARVVPRVRAAEIEPGEAVFKEGEPGDAVYLIDSGEVEAVKGSTPLSRLGAGDTFGEMALVTGAPRSATVMAVTKVRLFALGRDDFESLLRVSPATRRKVRDLVVERSGALASRSLVPDEKAEEWIEAAAGYLHDQDLAPTSLEISNAARAHGAAALGIWLGIFLDGIPESLVIGTSVTGLGSLSWALIAGIFLANLPEAMSSSVVMGSQGYSRHKILAMWFSITLVTGLGAFAGNVFLQEMSHGSFAIIEGAAAGAMLTMIAETMLPEAYEQGGAVVGLSTLLGFLTALFVKSIA